MEDIQDKCYHDVWQGLILHFIHFFIASRSRSSSNKLYFERSSSLPLSSSSLLRLEERDSFLTTLGIELLVNGGFSCWIFDSLSVFDELLDFRLRFGGEFFELRFLLLRSDDEDEELLSLERERDRDRDLERDLDLDRLLLRLECFELMDLLSLCFFFRRPNSSYSESEDSRSLYSTTPLSL